MDIVKCRGWLTIIAAGAIGAASGCVPMAIVPAVSSFNEARVGVQLPNIGYLPADKQAEAISKADAKAAEGDKPAE